MFLMIASLLFIGGCQVDTYPEVPAFEDEFTREFLPSTEEVEEGYYLFESKTGGYQMLFPENARISEFSYKKAGEEFETLIIENFNDEDDISVDHTLVYDFQGQENYEKILSARLNSLSTRVGYDGEYERFETKDKEIYYAHDTHNFEIDNSSHTVYRTFAYIIPKEGQFIVEYIYSTRCNVDINCSINQEEQKENAFKMMKSVKFMTLD